MPDKTLFNSGGSKALTLPKPFLDQLGITDNAAVSLEGDRIVITRRRPRTGVSLVQLRLAKALLDQIDLVRAQRTVAPSRHAWMLEAILDKLARDAAPDPAPARRVTRRV